MGLKPQCQHEFHIHTIYSGKKTLSRLLVASLLHQFDWSLPRGMDLADLLDEKFGLSMMKEKLLLLIPSPRKRSTG
ncbi:hypothetical protein RJ639_024712 [Escallonia herrerae]|uniref:Uncharacterized protein n=1 Tax=Escallonia herrerae TaxID=1293975 RepID=A0AA88UXN1_9ASTE|nr:hypothetical protein RJ639_024712 [Escallonia herrerae]